MSTSLHAILDAIESTLAANPLLARAMKFDELTEGANDLPMIQVYPEAGEQDAENTNDRTTYGGKVRITKFTITVDLYARQRSQLGEDMAALVALIDEMQTILDAQGLTLFGLPHIKSFRWSWQRVSFVYGDPQVTYVGARYTITTWTF